MNIFLSWSKEESKQYAAIFKKELSKLFTDDSFFMSDQDIGSGSISTDKIQESLAESNYGFLFVTDENANEAWLNYEAGALSKGIKSSHIVPIGFNGLEMQYLSSPLRNFQGFTFNEEKFRKTIKELNKQTKTHYNEAVLELVLDELWDKISSEVKKIEQNYKKNKNKSPKKSRNDIDDKLNLIITDIAYLREKQTPDPLNEKLKKYFSFDTIRLLEDYFSVFMSKNSDIFEFDSDHNIKRIKRTALDDFINYLKNETKIIDLDDFRVRSNFINVFSMYALLRHTDKTNEISTSELPF